MGWASRHIERLQKGETVTFRPHGTFVRGKVESGELCTVEPVDREALDVGAIVLCRVKGNELLHLVKAIDGDRFLIGNNRGKSNGWVGASAIFGRCTRVEA